MLFSFITMDNITMDKTARRCAGSVPLFVCESISWHRLRRAPDDHKYAPARRVIAPVYRSARPCLVRHAEPDDIPPVQQDAVHVPRHPLQVLAGNASGHQLSEGWHSCGSDQAARDEPQG